MFKQGRQESTHSFCPRCSELGYHSWLYEISWINSCPIHKHPLEEKNSSSPLSHSLNNFNPQNSQHYNSKSELIDALFNPTPYFEALSPLVSFCELDFPITPISTSNPFQGAYTLAEHNSHFANEEIYLSIMLAIYPSSREFVKGLNPSFQKSVIKRIPRHSKPNFHQFNLADLNARSNLVREKVQIRIEHLIQSVSGVKLTKTRLQEVEVLDYFYEGMDILIIAYKIWSSLLKISPSTHNRPKGFVGERIYINTFGYTAPLIPALMTNFTEGKQRFHMPGSPIRNENALPVCLSLLIYEVDCWCLFRSILTFLSTVVNGINSSTNNILSKGDLQRMLPSWAHPYSYYSDDIAIYLIDEQFVVVIPEKYQDIMCSDIGGFAPTIAPHCNAK